MAATPPTGNYRCRPDLPYPIIDDYESISTLGPWQPTIPSDTPILFNNLIPAEPIRVQAVRKPSRRRQDRRSPGRNIIWDPMNTKHPWAGGERLLPIAPKPTLNTIQKLYLAHSGKIDGDAFSSTCNHTGCRFAPEVYEHIVRSIVPKHDFIFATLKDVYFFLLHLHGSPGTEPDVLRDIRKIEVEDFTSGPYVGQALQLLRRCKWLRKLTLRYCGSCLESYARGPVLKALMSFRTKHFLHSRFNPDRLSEDFTLRLVARSKLCEHCDSMSLTPGGIPDWTRAPRRVRKIKDDCKRILMLYRLMTSGKMREG